jgi:hypothetical protein
MLFKMFIFSFFSFSAKISLFEIELLFKIKSVPKEKLFLFFSFDFVNDFK